MNLPHIVQRLLGIKPETDTSSIRPFRPEEFRAFCLAGKEHQMTASRICDDFRGYLRELRVPDYVVDTFGNERSKRRKR